MAVATAGAQLQVVQVHQNSQMMPKASLPAADRQEQLKETKVLAATKPLMATKMSAAIRLSTDRKPLPAARR
ncbi:hypothetical protein [Megasphaera stantonii]|uniref:hypothetical protein n=1 Tax=Megasphaera stantonii TaxID=2144175 RepID=UPI00320ABA79